MAFSRLRKKGNAGRCDGRNANRSSEILYMHSLGRYMQSRLAMTRRLSPEAPQRRIGSRVFLQPARSECSRGWQHYDSRPARRPTFCAARGWMDRTRVRVSLWVSRNACWIEEAAGAGLGHSPRVENSPTAAPYAGYDQRVRSGAGTSPPPWRGGNRACTTTMRTTARWYNIRSA